MNCAECRYYNGEPEDPEDWCQHPAHFKAILEGEKWGEPELDENQDVDCVYWEPEDYDNCPTAELIKAAWSRDPKKMSDLNAVYDEGRMSEAQYMKEVRRIVKGGTSMADVMTDLITVGCNDMTVIPMDDEEVIVVRGRKIMAQGTSLVVAITSEARELGLGRGDEVDIMIRRKKAPEWGEWNKRE